MASNCTAAITPPPWLCSSCITNTNYGRFARLERKEGEREDSDDGRANERAGGERVMWSETRSGADAEMGGSEDRQRRRGNCSWYDWLARGRPGEKRERPKKLQNFYAASQRFSVANGKISEYRVTHLLAD